MPAIVMNSGSPNEQVIRIGQDPVIIGRTPACNIRVDDAGVSRSHAEISHQDGTWFLRDLGSSNGTVLNGQPAKSKHPLKDGDVIKVGSVPLKFAAETSAAKPKVAVAKTVSSAAASTEAVQQKVNAPPQLDNVEVEAIESMKDAMSRIRHEVHKVIIGQDQVLDEVLTAMLSRGHCLMVGMPGLAKTLMVSTIAQVLDLDFKRVQFTPDLMPSDITGTDILEEKEGTGKKNFRFIRGPIFTNILLADEINRTPPKTQASLLEAMQEYRVTTAGYSYNLDKPFFVLATQNPLEQEGTYPLPEAQLDRFMFNIFVDYPEALEEEAIVQATTYIHRPDPQKVLNQADILNLQSIVRRVPVPDPVIQYAVKLVRGSRPDMEDSPEFITDYVQCGAGPRACQYLILAAKARAVLQGRPQANFEDVRAAAIPVMRHRIFTNFNADSEGISASKIVEDLVGSIPEPSNRSYSIVRKVPQSTHNGPIVLPKGNDDEKVDLAAIRKMREAADAIRAEVGKVIVGQEEVLNQVLMSMLSRGHCLMVGMPGLAKTLMVRTISDVLDLDFKRIQFTPDLMPSDITGTDILEEDEKTGQKNFRFIKGPIFTNILLADEINRTPPKTQAALLEAMQEYRVTASGTTYQIPLPFFVLATQNPLEQEGTYPLPEAQLDRFMFNIWVDYPDEKQEEIIVKQTTKDLDVDVNKIISAEEILRLQDVVRRVPVSSHVVKYATTLVRMTRPNKENHPLQFINDWVHCGAGPRACQYLILGAKARAVLEGRCNVSCADVKATAIPVLRHRLFTNFNADSEGVGPVEIVERLINSVREPSDKEYRERRTAQASGAQQAPAARPIPQPPRQAPQAKPAKKAQPAQAKPAPEAKPAQARPVPEAKPAPKQPPTAKEAPKQPPMAKEAKTPPTAKEAPKKPPMAKQVPLAREAKDKKKPDQRAQ